MLDGGLGALSCNLVGRPIPLHDLGLLRNSKDAVPMSKEVVASELFIARVMRVESMSERTLLPLVYYRRCYTTCRDVTCS